MHCALGMQSGERVRKPCPQIGPRQYGQSSQSVTIHQNQRSMVVRKKIDGAPYIGDHHGDGGQVTRYAPVMNFHLAAEGDRQALHRRVSKSVVRRDAGTHQHLTVFAMLADELASYRQLLIVLWRGTQVAHRIVGFAPEQGGRASRFNCANQQASQHGTPSHNCSIFTHSHPSFSMRKHYFDLDTAKVKAAHRARGWSQEALEFSERRATTRSDLIRTK